MKKVRLSLKGRSYDILIGRDLLRRAGEILAKLALGRDAVVISNSRILRLYGEAFRRSLAGSRLTARFERVPDSEKAKAHRTAVDLLDRIAAYDKRKTLFIVAFGGGVIGDLAGFVAAVYKRGVPYAQIPTTLLAQVDSAIGGKTGIDLPVAKNLAGAFHQPKVVISDISLLKTLSPRQVRNGLAEIIKYAVIGDRRFFGYLESNYGRILRLDDKSLEFVISRSSAIKARLVEKDELDRKGIRAALNYGHTIGHAIETAEGYSDLIYHGEAIAIGMVVAGRIAVKMGMMRPAELARIKSLIGNAGLPTKIRSGRLFAPIFAAHLHDKKFIRGKNRLVLPTGIGRVRIVEGVPDSVIRGALKEESVS
jgi:3-dehydroquinate synthase